MQAKAALHMFGRLVGSHSLREDDESHSPIVQFLLFCHWSLYSKEPHVMKADESMLS